MDQNALQQIIDRLKEANNVLVTVSANPSVDQLAACIGFTLLLNHLGKHGTAVFSGAVPSTIEFLKPDDTLEKNTDSLRDFIIALDKSKADKLRYKVEDTVVKIFITPYRTSISDKDLDFSQGDFNVDAVMALGVHERTELDKAIMDHGRILHDATVISVNNKDQGNLGAINWVDLNASSLSEMMVELAHAVTKDPLDSQMATAFMTGIVAETNRFSNTKTSPRTMSLASELMSAGANQQLIASKLEAAQDIPETPTQIKSAKEPEEAEAEEAAESSDGSLQITHGDSAKDDVASKEDIAPVEPVEEPEEAEEVEEVEHEPAEELPKLQDVKESKDEVSDIFGGLSNPAPSAPATSGGPPDPATLPPLPGAPRASNGPAAGMPNRASMALDPPTMGGQLTANSVPESMQTDHSVDPLSLPAVDAAAASPQLLNRSVPSLGAPLQPLAPVEDSPVEKGEELDDARDAVSQAIAADPTPRTPDPIQALGAQPLNLDLHNDAPSAPAPSEISGPATPADESLPQPLPSLDTAPPPMPQVPFTPPSNDLPDQSPPPLPYVPAPDPSHDPLASPAGSPLQPFGAPPSMNGVNPNVPNNLLPPSQPVDPTASTGNPSAPPPVPPPLMPPSDTI